MYLAKPDSARLIPARAGNTVAFPSGGGASPAHPRSRGEHKILPMRITARSGSSPLARGTPERKTQNGTQPRLIPARAGNTVWVRAPAWSSSAHPRSRGEHPGSHEDPRGACGSSPLARGTRVSAPYSPARVRLIPARAGNTACSLRGMILQPAHPRSRGEHSRGNDAGDGVFGSSPLARGTRPSQG